MQPCAIEEVNTVITFHPCPYHFPNLWRKEHICLPKPTPEQIAHMRLVYRLPDDDEDSDIRRALRMTWGDCSIEDIARTYARSWFCTPHGFLVRDEQLIEGPFYGLEDIRSQMELLQCPATSIVRCMTRAEAFELPEEHPRIGWASAMGRAQEHATSCRPAACRTWPTAHAS